MAVVEFLKLRKSTKLSASLVVIWGKHRLGMGARYTMNARKPANTTFVCGSIRSGGQIRPIECPKLSDRMLAKL